MGRASCPPRGRLTPHESVGGVRRPRADLWSPLRGPRVGFAAPPRPPGPRAQREGFCVEHAKIPVGRGSPDPAPPSKKDCRSEPKKRLFCMCRENPSLKPLPVSGPRGGAGGGCGATRAAARPFRRRLRPARAPSPPLRRHPPRCHAASARPGPGLFPAFHRAAPARPFRRRPRPARVPRPPLRRIGLDRHAASARPAPRPLPRSAARPWRVRAGPRPARAPRPPPARAAARPPCRSGRGLHRAASMRPVRLIIHIFTVPEIPYFTGFSSRQAR